MTLARVGLLALLASLGCSSNEFQSQPVLVNVAGTWGATIRNESNSCPGAFNVGEVNQVELLATQDGPRVTMKLQGNVGFWVNLLFGSDTFSGTL
jgi:hypothetical protein